LIFGTSKKNCSGRGEETEKHNPGSMKGGKRQGTGEKKVPPPCRKKERSSHGRTPLPIERKRRGVPFLVVGGGRKKGEQSSCLEVRVQQEKVMGLSKASHPGREEGGGNRVQLRAQREGRRNFDVDGKFAKQKEE